MPQLIRPSGFLAGLAACALGAAASAAPAPEVLPTGQTLTPTAARSAIFQTLNPDLPDLPGFTAGQASAVALSPDGRTLLILTSGFNRNFGPDGKMVASQSNEYVFVYDVVGAKPVTRDHIAQRRQVFDRVAQWAALARRALISAAIAMAAIRLDGSATPLAAMSSAVP